MASEMLYEQTINYDNNLNVLKIEESTKRVTEYTYNENNLITQSKTKFENGKITVISYEYNKDNKLISQIQVEDDITTVRKECKYIDNKISEVEENYLDNIVIEKYDDKGNLIYNKTNTDETFFEYTDNKLTTVSKTTGPCTSIEYNELGHIIRSTTLNIITDYEYNELNDIISIVNTRDNVIISKIEYIYNENNEVYQIKEYMLNETNYILELISHTEYGYTNGRETSSKDLLNNITITRTYNEIGQLVDQISSEGIIEHFDYNDKGLLSIYTMNDTVTEHLYNENDLLRYKSIVRI